jgi:hypothetical protein
LLQTQSSIIKAMVPRAAEMETPFEVTPLLKLVPEHAYISLDPNQVFSLLAPILPLNPDNVHVVKLWQDTP